MTSTPKWLGFSALGFLLFAITSCEDPKEIGSEIIGQDVGVRFTDTLSINSSTVLVDSIFTSGTYTRGADTLLVGAYTDPILGKTQANAFFQVANIDTLKALPSAIADSVILKLFYTYYQGDTTKTQTINVHRVTETMNPATEYLANNEVQFDKKPLGAKTLRARPVRYRSRFNELDSLRFDSLSIKLDKALALEFMNLRYTKGTADTVVYSQAKFKDKFKGIALVGNESDNAALLGFYTRACNLSFYYHPKDSLRSSRLIFYPVLTTNAGRDIFNSRFNKITSTRSGRLANLKKPGDIIPSNQTGNEVYIQEGTGVSTKILFPTLLSLKQRQDIAINKAELIVPVKSNPNNIDQISKLSLVETNETNRTVRLVTTSGASGLLYIPGERSGYPHNTLLNKTANTYTFNVTSTLQNILTGRRPNKGILIVPEIVVDATTGKSKLFANRTDRIAIDAPNVKLKVYYTYTGK
jgi:hypothetical protein